MPSLPWRIEAACVCVLVLCRDRGDGDDLFKSTAPDGMKYYWKRQGGTLDSLVALDLLMKAF